MITKCLFCGRDTTNCKSVEHIIPESLGNIELILPKGVVCDKCNNYFANEIESKVLSIQSFKDLCFFEFIPNKKGRLKHTSFLVCGEECKADWGIVDGKAALLLGASPTTIKALLEQKPELIISRGITLDDKNYSYEISRFLYKIAIEYYVFLLLQLEENKDADCFIYEEEFNKIIDFVRKGNRNKNYFVYNSTIENEFMPFKDNGTIKLGFFMKNDDLIFEINLFGTKFSINISNPIYNK